MTHKEKGPEKKEISITNLLKRAKIITGVAFVLTIIFVYFIVYEPMAETLKADQIQAFSLVSHLDYHIIEGSFLRGIEAANSLSSRTMIRNAITDYKSGKITIEALQKYTAEKYADGAKTIEYLLSANRCVDGVEVADYITQGVDLEELAYRVQYPDDEISETTASVKKIGQKILASVISPIYSGDTILGYDFVLYDLTEQFENVNGHSVHMQIITRDDYNTLLKDSQFISSDAELTTIKKNDSYYTVGNVNEMIYIVTQETQETLFKNVMKQTQIIIAAGVILFVFFAIFFYTYIVKFINSGLIKLENSRDTFKNIAYKDSLTKAYTRSFLKTWNESIRKPDLTYSIILMDIDDFKYINDEFGHQIGDKMLSELSKIFMNRIRSNDYFFRFGGDEFILLLEDFPENKIVQKLDYFMDLIKKIELPKGTVSISYGISTLGIKDDIEEKINLADSKMYKQKKEKKKCLPQ